MVDNLDPTHETAVTDFMRRAVEAQHGPMSDDDYAAWLESGQYPVLTEDQLAWRRSKEVRLTETFANTLSLSTDIFGRRIAAPLEYGRPRRMKNLLSLAAVALLALTACGNPFVHSSVSPLPKATVGIRDGGPQAPMCAEKTARAQASPDVPVVGAFACLTAELQAYVPQELGVPVASDRDLAAYAASDPVFTHYTSCGQNGAYWYFDLTNAAGGHEGFRAALNDAGLVSNLGFSSSQSSTSTCPT